MSQKINFYPLGNAETCLLEISNGDKILFDYADVKTEASDDKRINLSKELSSISKYKVVMFTHAHDDHTHGAEDYFYFDHAAKYQSDNRAKIEELWVSSAFIVETDLENASSAKIIRNEARHRLLEGYGIKVFAKSDELVDWLKDHEVEYDDIKHLIIEPGTTISKAHFNNEMEIHVHAPFEEEVEDVDDKNEPSIVLQLRLFNNNGYIQKKTNVLITGDTTYQVIDKIVDSAIDSGNEDRLCWDIYDIPHHCSHTAVGEKDEKSNSVEPTKNVKLLLSKANKNAYMVASCDKITSETSPPHLIAKKAYINNTTDDVSFIVTMENENKEQLPQILRFKIDYLGVTKLDAVSKNAFSTKAAPRAGALYWRSLFEV